MHIQITCPDCGKKFTIDVPAVDKYKSDNAKLKTELAKLRQQLADMKNTSSVDYLRNIFGMED